LRQPTEVSRQRAQSPQTLAGWHTRTPSAVRSAQQPLVQSLLTPQRPEQTAGEPAQTVGTDAVPEVCAQHSESVVQLPPTCTVQVPAVDWHHRATVQAENPLVSAAQQPDTHELLPLHSAVHTCPTP
jgi:hypothetical protein